MIPFRSLASGLPSFLRWSSNLAGSGINIPSVTIYDVEENTDKRARTLKHLLKANHINHSILFNSLRFHNHCPHFLGAAYTLGATVEQLNTAYNTESKELDPWKDSPGEISQEDWRDFLGKKRYARAYVDFFEDQIVQHSYDWREMLNEFLFEGENPMINGLTCGLSHPLIHLAYAYELSSPSVAVEALGLAAVCYDDTHKYSDDPSYTKPAENPTTNLLELLSRLANDKRFAGIKSNQNDELGLSFWAGEKEKLMLEYWNSWDLTNPTKQFEDSQNAASAILVGTPTKKQPLYDFFLLHVLTSSHAVRVMLPVIPSKWHVPLVRQWWLFALTAMVLRDRPAIDLARIENFDLKGRDWKYVVDRALTSKYSDDAHYVKACRSLKVAAETWGDKDQYYLKAAVRFAEEFDGYAH